MNRLRCIPFLFLGTIVPGVRAQLFAPVLNGIEGNAVTVLYGDSLHDQLIVGGGFTYIDGVQVSPLIASWNGIQWSSLNCGFEWDCTSVTSAAGSPNPLKTAVLWDGELYAGGYFSEADGQSANNIARWDGTSWHSLGGGTDGSVQGLKAYPDGLYVAGWFNYADTVEAHGLARWDGTQWHSVHDLPLWNGVVNGVYDVEVYNGTVYIGGNFSNGSTINDFAYFDGTQWVSPGNLGLLGGFCQINKMRLHDSLLYIMGSFQDGPPNGVASNPASGIATWNGSAYGDLGGGTDGASNAAVLDAVWINDTLYALGRFNIIGGVPCSKLAYWDGQHWCCMTPPGYWTNDVVSIGTWRDSLYVGGSFTAAGGMPISRIAKWVGGSYADTCQTIVGIAEAHHGAEQLLLWPNPALDALHLNNALPAQVTITDATGRQVMAASIPDNGTLPVGELASGCYILHLRTAQQRMLHSARFVKQ